ncbi:MAG: bacteriophage holin [Halobacteria archaeon]|nr:bacteriophage holin [Halobacteria archaeon]
MKLNVKAFAIAVALVWGLGIFIGTWWIIFLDGTSSDMTSLGYIYRGYTITPVGSVIGMVWGLVDGLIGGAIFAWLYNLIAART